MGLNKLLKKAKKMCLHLLIDKWLMHNLDFRTLLLISVKGSKNQDTLESEDEAPQDVANNIQAWKRKPQVQWLKYAKMSMDKRETFSKHLYTYFTEMCRMTMRWNTAASEEIQGPT